MRGELKFGVLETQRRKNSGGLKQPLFAGRRVVFGAAPAGVRRAAEQKGAEDTAAPEGKKTRSLNLI